MPLMQFQIKLRKRTDNLCGSKGTTNKVPPNIYTMRSKGKETIDVLKAKGQHER